VTSDDEIRSCGSTVSNRYKLMHTRVSSTRFWWCILCLNDTSYSKSVSEGTNRNMPARNTLVQLLAVYTNPESHNAQHHRQTDRQTDRRTYGQQDEGNSRPYYVAVRSARNTSTAINEGVVRWTVKCDRSILYDPVCWCVCSL